MPDRQWDHKIFGACKENFDTTALEVFRFQALHNPVYGNFLQALQVDPARIVSTGQIPFLPVRFFKSHAVQTTAFEPELVFESSGTSGTANSLHRVKNLGLYRQSFTRGFELFYGPVQDWCILGLLPSYLERKGSSLVYMMEQLIKRSGHPGSGFYLHDHEKLSAMLGELEKKGQKTLLLGVTYALLDFAEKFPQPLRHTIVMETGGMKGRRRELLREEVHLLLKKAFGVSSVHSEYGMTELLSQAYSKGEGIFACPPWMKILLRDEEDPFTLTRSGSGIINVIDLANIYSCSFIATDDAGKLHPDGRFKVLGRVDGSDIRGCTLLTIG